MDVQWLWRLWPRQWAVVRVRLPRGPRLVWAVPLAPLEELTGVAAGAAALAAWLRRGRRPGREPGALPALQGAVEALRALRRSAPGRLLEVEVEMEAGAVEVRVDLW